MPKLINLRLNGIQLKVGEEESLLLSRVADALGIPTDSIKDSIKEMHIVKKSLDARKKSNLFYVYTVEATCFISGTFRPLNKGISIERVIPEPAPELKRGTEMLIYPPVIIGAGPAGIFAALTLAKMGYRPMLIEQGKDVRSRVMDVETFWRSGQLDETSNTQFGEGGAGTFSDGKLTFRGRSAFAATVFNELVQCGAPPDILYWHKPHLGTDVLRKVVPNIRRKIIALGGQVFFETQMEEILIENGRIRGIKIKGKGEIPVSLLLLAPGNSSRKVYEMLFKKEVAMEAKPFAVGVRIEHSQKYINEMQYGQNACSTCHACTALLPVADYNFTWQYKDRGVYTFCMCPGGYVVNASSHEGHLVTNGMSFSPRASGRSNSAVVAAVDKKDFGDGVLDGMRFQQQLERKAFALGGSDYCMPSQTVGSFISSRQNDSDLSGFKPLSYGVKAANLHSALPAQVHEAIISALIGWSAKQEGFIGRDVFVTGVETRTSAPVRILRNEFMESVSTQGLYPLGEGAGYAGGITSSAIDGMKAATCIIERFAPPSVDFPSDLLLK